MTQTRNYPSNFICMTMQAWISRKFSRDCSRILFIDLFFVFSFFLFLFSFFFFFLPLEHLGSCVSVLLHSYLYQWQIYWGAGCLHYTLPSALLCWPWPIQALSYEREWGPRSWHISVTITSSAALSSICWPALNHEKYLRVISLDLLVSRSEARLVSPRASISDYSFWE